MTLLPTNCTSSFNTSCAFQCNAATNTGSTNTTHSYMHRTRAPTAIHSGTARTYWSRAATIRQPTTQHRSSSVASSNSSNCSSNCAHIAFFTSVRPPALGSAHWAAAAAPRRRSASPTVCLVPFDHARLHRVLVRSQEVGVRVKLLEVDLSAARLHGLLNWIERTPPGRSAVALGETATMASGRRAISERGEKGPQPTMRKRMGVGSITSWLRRRRMGCLTRSW